MPEPSPSKISLDVITIDDPCTVPWEDMRGDDRVRFCGLCQRSVYDLTEMTRADAEALLTESLLPEHRGRLCVQLYRRADGTIQTADCAPDRLAELRRRAKRTLGVAASIAGAVLSATIGLAAAFREPEAAPTRAVASVTKLVQRVEQISVQPPPPPPEPEEPPPPHHRLRGRVRTRR